MRWFLGLLMTVALVFSAATPGKAADILGDTKVPFSADRTVLWKGKTYAGRVYAVPGKQRHEQEINGFHPFMLLRADREIAYLVLPELHIYTDFPFPRSVIEQVGADKIGHNRHEEMLHGVRTEMYQIDRSGDDGSRIEGKGWTTIDGIPLLIDGDYINPDGKPEKARLEISNLQRGPQDPALFELPQGFNRLPPEAIAALFNLRLPKSQKG